MKILLTGLALAFIVTACGGNDGRPDTPKPPGTEDHHPALRCAYYPEYNVSLLYLFDNRVSASAMIGKFFIHNICK